MGIQPVSMKSVCGMILVSGVREKKKKNPAISGVQTGEGYFIL